MCRRGRELLTATVASFGPGSELPSEPLFLMHGGTYLKILWWYNLSRHKTHKRLLLHLMRPDVCLHNGAWSQGSGLQGVACKFCYGDFSTEK